MARIYIFGQLYFDDSLIFDNTSPHLFFDSSNTGVVSFDVSIDTAVVEKVVLNEVPSVSSPAVVCTVLTAQSPVDHNAFNIDVDFDIVVTNGCLDISLLVPEKFRQSVLMQQYLTAYGCQMSQWMSVIAGLSDLVNPDTVPVQFIEQLAGNIGFDLTRTVLNESDADLAFQLALAVSWYKAKGTYAGLETVLYASGFGGRVQDLWTNNYSNFAAYIADPAQCRSNDSYLFVLNDGGCPNSGDASVPQTIPSGYFKTPHFLLTAVLGNCYVDSAGRTCLFSQDLWTLVQQRIEENRPAHTVPHFKTELDLNVDMCGTLMTTGATGCPILAVGSFPTCLSEAQQFFDTGTKFDIDHYINTAGTSDGTGALACTLSNHTPNIVLGTVVLTDGTLTVTDQETPGTLMRGGTAYGTVSSGGVVAASAGAFGNTVGVTADYQGSGGVSVFDESPASCVSGLTGIHNWELGVDSVTPPLSNATFCPYFPITLQAKDAVTGTYLQQGVAASVATFTISNIANAVKFVIHLPESVVVTGITELKMYSTDGTKCVVATFPPIDKLAGVALDFVVTVSTIPCVCKSMAAPYNLSPCCTALPAPVGEKNT